MGRDKYKQISMIFVVLALVISLAMNVTILNRLSKLDNQVTSVSNAQQDIYNNINDQTIAIQNVLNNIKEEQSWISTITMDVNTKELERGQVNATFEWQVKEFKRDSKVVFNYAYGDSEFTALPAQELQHGIFQVNIPLEVEFEPLWEVGVMTTNSDEQLMIENKRKEEQRQDLLRYFVSMSHDEMIKSGGIQTEDLGYFGADYFGTIQSDIHMDNDNFSVTLMNHKVNDTSIVVEEAYLLKYEDERLIGEEELKPGDMNDSPEHMERFFHLDQIEKYDDMHLVIKVVYSNGATFEKEIY